MRLSPVSSLVKLLTVLSLLYWTRSQTPTLAVSGKIRYLRELTEEYAPQVKRGIDHCTALFRSVSTSKDDKYNLKEVYTNHIPAHLIDDFTLEGLIPSLDAFVLPGSSSSGNGVHTVLPVLSWLHVPKCGSSFATTLIHWL